MNKELSPLPHPAAAPGTLDAQVDCALWQLGFRPFYLLAAFFSVLSILLWVAQFTGHPFFRYLQASLAHAHEMLFGYMTAVIAGFLLTAVRAWTNQSTATGWPLMALAGLWVAGRLLVFTPLTMTATVVNATFPVALAVAIGIPLWRARSVRNYFFVGLLVLMSALIVLVHLGLQGRIEVSPHRALQLVLDVMLFIMAVMGGRVIPMFTNNGIPGVYALRHALVEKMALGSVIGLFAMDVLPTPQVLSAAMALLAALAHGTRLYLWKPWRTLKTPLIWILHAAYVWIVIYLVLRGFSNPDRLSGHFAIHALTVGAMGGLTLGMMTRTAKGHTGRPLVADHYERAMFILVQGAAVVRVFGGMLFPGLFAASIVLSGSLWALAFGLYTVRYWPILMYPRVDGKPG